jgi:hypothetical protein
MAETTRSFTRERPSISFEVDGDVFRAAPAVPAGTLVEFGTRYADVRSGRGVGEQFETLYSVLELVLLPDSYKLLGSRLVDRERPVDLSQLNDIIVWLLDQYGLRPTGAPSVSSAGSPPPVSGTSSTDGAPVPDSIPLTFLPAAS